MGRRSKAFHSWLELLISTGLDYRIRGFADGYSDWDGRFKVGLLLLIKCGETTMETLSLGKVEDLSLKENKAIDIQGRSPKEKSCHQPTNRMVLSVDILCLKIDQRKEIQALNTGREDNSTFSNPHIYTVKMAMTIIHSKVSICKACQKGNKIGGSHFWFHTIAQEQLL